MKKFTNEDADARKMWREANLVTLNEAQLEEMDRELMEYKRLSTRHALHRWLVHRGAAGWIGNGEIAVRPDKYEAELHRIKQWSRWRGFREPFEARAAFARLVEERKVLDDAYAQGVDTKR